MARLSIIISRLTLLSYLAMACFANAVEIDFIEAGPSEGIDRAVIRYVVPKDFPKAILVLCPGLNADCKEQVEAGEWQSFAERNNLGLVGISFASSDKANFDGSGYVFAGKGSGVLLLEAIEKIYGRIPPIILYGFSGGARFASSFEEWKPSAVLAWSAYSASLWERPREATANPPGLIACGDSDDRLAASLVFFKQGRALGKPWLWATVPNTGHERNFEFEDFVRIYFQAILNKSSDSPILVDLDFATEISGAQPKTDPSLSAELPSRTLLPSWRKIHSTH